jgi:KDO2-lipid IV(A) lauroyltransferase
LLEQGSAYLLVALLWSLHWLPLPALAALGSGLGSALYYVVPMRRKVALTNLALCFPQLGEGEREKMARAHFRLLGRSLLERGLLWWGSETRIRKLVRFEGAERLRGLLDSGRAVILLTPHFVGLDAGGTRLSMDFDVVNIYARQRNPVIDRLVYRGRTRFGDQLLLARGDSIRASVKAMKSGRPFYYMPDMNQRKGSATFAPFFGVPAATVSGLSRFARMADAVVLTCVTRMLPGGQGYVLSLGEPWADFPGEDVDADVLRMNRVVEELVLTMPEQYYWVHKRFKTRPPGVPKRY